MTRVLGRNTIVSTAMVIMEELSRLASRASSAVYFDVLELTSLSSWVER